MNNGVIRRKNKSERPVTAFFENLFLKDKLNNWLGYVLVALMAAGFGLLVAKQAEIGIGLFSLIFGFFVVLACMVNTELGFYINLVYAFFAFHFSRLLFNDTFPVGIVTDVLIVATFLSLFVKRKNLRGTFNRFVKNSVVVWMLVVLVYLFIELFNPNGHTFEGWFQTFRRFLGSVLVLFIAYYLFDSYVRVRRFLILLFALCVIAGFYACIQQWHGLFPFEEAWVKATDNRYGLIFINNNYRKFSTFSDPTAFGILMAAAAIFFLIFSLHQKRISYKLILITGCMIMILGMAYSGTRTANIMLAGGAAVFILLSFHKRSTKIFAVFATMSFLFMLYVPIYSNPTLNRFRTSFFAKEDESFKVRERNRAFIQPYILSHPIGGGLGTAGSGGIKYAPHHYLAQFPPDSGYLKKALETGFIGLAMICMLYFSALRQGVREYFRSRSERNKIIYAGAIAALFSFYIAEFPQEAIGQITDMVVYYPLIALVLKLRYLEEPEEGASPEVKYYPVYEEIENKR
jgi:hypothetical protein